jgi:hypothetical protein
MGGHTSSLIVYCVAMDSMIGCRHLIVGWPAVFLVVPKYLIDVNDFVVMKDFIMIARINVDLQIIV